MRKQPRQERSRATVERIVDAAREVLVTDGYDALSTNRVAAAAGVSPGSLYQYFPDKAAVLDVVIDRYWDDIAERIAASLGDHVGPEVADTVRAVGDALLRALESDRALLRVVYEELPPNRLRQQRAALERRVHQLAATALVARPGGADRGRVQAWFVVMAVEHLAVRWVLDDHGIGRDAFLDELVALIAAYL